MKARYTRALTYVVVVGIILAFAYTTSGRKGGWGDSYNDGDECLGCHMTNQNLSLGAGYTSITIGTSEPTITLKAQVDMTNVPSRSGKYGVLLVTPQNGNLSDDRWTILSDPNQNDIPKNYIERDSSDSSLLLWRLKNSPGHYTIKVLAMYGSQGKEFYNEAPVNVIIPSQTTNTPPIAKRSLFVPFCGLQWPVLELHVQCSVEGF